MADCSLKVLVRLMEDLRHLTQVRFRRSRKTPGFLEGGRKEREGQKEWGEGEREKESVQYSSERRSIISEIEDQIQERGSQINILQLLCLGDTLD